MKRLLLVVALLGAVLLIAVLGLGWLLARPVPQRVGAAPPDLGAVAVRFPSESDTTVHAWWCPSTEGGGTIVLLPGIRANRRSMIERARFFRRAGYSVLLPDLQGTGETPGERITFGWREREDVLAAVAFVRRQRPNSRVAIVGSSVGGAAALLAVPELRVDAVVLESVYPTIERAMRNRLEMRLGTFGRLVAPLLLVQLRTRIGVSAAQLRPVDRIAGLTCPVLIISGTRDRHTTPADTQLLYERAAEPKQLWLVPGAAHVDLYRASTEEYERRVGAFLREALGG